MLVTYLSSTFNVPDRVYIYIYIRQIEYDVYVLKPVQNPVQNTNRTDVLVHTNGGVYHEVQAP